MVANAAASPDPDEGNAEITPVAPKRSLGRATEYDPDYCEALVTFFENRPTTQEYVSKRMIITDPKHGDRVVEEFKIIAGDLPTFEGFAQQLGVVPYTLIRWARQHAAFGEAYARARAAQKAWILTVASKGLMPPVWATFLAKNTTRMTDEGANGEQSAVGKSRQISISAFEDHKAAQASQAAKAGPSSAR